MKKKICIATGSRSEYGLLKPLIDKITEENQWDVQLLITGMHLSPEYGNTFQQINVDGVIDSKKIEMLVSSDTPIGVVKSMGVGLIGFADALSELQPDLLIVLGDRFEMLAVVQAALIFKIPVAHIHGGEVTEGAYDNAIRHAITKMSHLHFTSTELYRQRVIQMGEEPGHVFNVGALGLDNIYNNHFLSKKELEKELEITFKKYNYLVTYHPVTLSDKSSSSEFGQLLLAIRRQEDSCFIFTKSNADNGGKVIDKMIDDFVRSNPENAVAFTSMGSFLYLSAMRHVDAVIGNSSSGIIEAPSCKIATINIGDRQKGRVQANTVVNCLAKEDIITQAFEHVKSSEFKNFVKEEARNPYGEGQTAQKIVQQLKRIDWDNLAIKKFFDFNTTFNPAI